MKELLYGWMRDIALYSLLMTVIMHLIPESDRRRYLRFFMGIVLIIVVISPVLKAAGPDGELDAAYTAQTWDAGLQDFMDRQEEIEAKYTERMEREIEAAEEEQAAYEERMKTENATSDKEEDIDGSVFEIRIKIGEE